MKLLPHVFLANSLALVAATALLVSGCSRTEAPAAVAGAAAAPATTTIGNEIDDTVITTKVKSALLENPDTKSFDIKVETRKGLVQLSGFVNNQSQADGAITIARKIEGVKNIDNAMTLKEGKASLGNVVDDSIVTATVKSALLADPDTKSFEIAVVTRKGEVQLSGFVGTQAQIDRAAATVRGVAGVTGVINQIAIK